MDGEGVLVIALLLAALWGFLSSSGGPTDQFGQGMAESSWWEHITDEIWRKRG